MIEEATNPEIAVTDLTGIKMPDPFPILLHRLIGGEVKKLARHYNHSRRLSAG